MSLTLPQFAGAAAMRILLPWQDVRWPQAVELEFVNPPSRIGRGETVEWLVRNRRGELPKAIDFQLRDAADAAHERRLPMQIVGDFAKFTLENIDRPFSYRATGGDDNALPWIAVEVVPSPRIASWQVTAYPPPDSGRKPRVVSPPLRILAGSRLEIRGVATPEWTMRLRSEHELWTAAVAADGRFQLPSPDHAWTPIASGLRHLEAIDATGVVGRQASIQIEVVPDQAPAIDWQTPVDGLAAEHGRIVVRGAITDDVRVKRVGLAVARTDGTDEMVIPLWQSSATAVETTEAEFDRIQLNAPLEVSSLPGSAAGTEYSLRLIAEDSNGGVTRTDLRRLKVVSADAFQEHIFRDIVRWTQLLSEATRLQRAARDLVAQVVENPSQTAAAVEASQQQVTLVLLDSTNGLQRQLRTALEAWDDNRMTAAPIIDAWRRTEEEIRDLGERELPAAGRAASTLSRRHASETEKAAAGDAAITAQDEILLRLERCLREVTAEAQGAELERDFSALKSAQIELQERTTQARLLALTGDANVGELSRLLRREQADLARQADRLQARLTAGDANAGENSERRAAAEVCRRAALGTRMRDASNDLGEGRTAEAVALQAEVITALDDILAALRPAGSAAPALDAWERRLTELNRLEKRQQAAVQAWQEAAGSTEAAAGADTFRLTEQQLAAETAATARTVEDSALRKVAGRLNEAAEKLRSAAAIVNAQTPRESLAAGLAAEEALRTARQELIAAIDGARKENVRRQLSRLAEQVRGFVVRQKQLCEQTKSIAERYRESAEWTRPLQVDLQGSAAGQADLAAAVQETAAEAPATFKLVLLSAARSMIHAARRMDGREIDEQTQRLQTAAADTLAQLQKALAEEANQAASDSSSSPENMTGEQSAVVRSAAELELVLTRQRNVKRQTGEVHDRFRNDSQGLHEALREPAEQQRQLAELMELWTRDGGGDVPRPLPEEMTDADFERRVAQALQEGEDIGEKAISGAARLADRMRLAAAGLERGRAGRGTQLLQDAAVRELELMMVEARRQQRSGGERSQAGKGGNTPSADGDPTGAAANDSTQRNARPTELQFDPRQINRLLRGVWGHLPEKTREQMENTASDEFLPQYERLIINYYRRLADERIGRP